VKAAYINETGPPEVIQFDELPTPVAKGAELLVRVNAVAVNPIDTYLRAGAGYWDLPQPFIIGCDFAGVVERVGPDANRFKQGDRVWGSNQGLLGRQGTFSEFCAVNEQWAYPIPDNVDEKTAAAISLVGITAHLGLFRDAKLQPGETILVSGGSGGVGSTVVQLAKAHGAKVIATGGSAEKVEACRTIGADVAVNYITDNVADAIEEFSPGGVDVYWETCREPNFESTVPMLAERARYVLMAGRDACPAFPVGPFYVKGCSLHGFAMFKATAQEQRHCGEGINQLLSSGKLRPRIDRVMRLSQAAEAHRIQEENTIGKQGTLSGKIVLVTDT